MRQDLPHTIKTDKKITVGRIPPSSSRKPTDVSLGFAERSSLIRTEELSWSDMALDALEKAVQSKNFHSVFTTKEVLKEIDCDITKQCIAVPFGVSRSILIKGRPCPWDAPSPLTADVVESLSCQGAMAIGYIKSDPLFFEHDLCAEAVAQGLPFALSADLYGNALESAARNGVFAIRPTYGLCSRMGLLCRAPSMQQISITARDIHSMATVLSCIMHSKHNDSTSYSTTLADWYQSISTLNLTSRTIAIAKNVIDARSNPLSSLPVIKAAELFAMMGANVVDIDLPLADQSLCNVITAGESRIEEIIKYGDISLLSSSAKTEIMLKHLLLSDGDTLYNARCSRNALAQALEKSLSNVSVFICPTVYDDGTPTGVAHTIALAGMCAVTVPCGRTPQGVGLGLIIAGRQFSEADLLGIGKLYQKANQRLKEITTRGRRNKNSFGG